MQGRVDSVMVCPHCGDIHGCWRDGKLLTCTIEVVEGSDERVREVYVLAPQEVRIEMCSRCGPVGCTTPDGQKLRCIDSVVVNGTRVTVACPWLNSGQCTVKRVFAEKLMPKWESKTCTVCITKAEQTGTIGEKPYDF